MIRFTLYFLLLFLVIPGTTVAQQKLLLTKQGTKKMTYFYVGEEMKFRVKGADNFAGGTIVGFTENDIVFKEFEINKDSIAAIDVRDKHLGGFNIGQYGPSLIVAGGLLMVADLINQEQFDGETAAIAGGISGGGVVLTLLRKKLFKIGGRNKIIIVN